MVLKSIGLVAINGDALHPSMLWKIVIDGSVLGATVVPNRKAVGLPLEHGAPKAYRLPAWGSTERFSE